MGDTKKDSCFGLIGHARGHEEVAAHVALDAQLVVEIEELAPPSAHGGQGHRERAPCERALLEGEVKAAALHLVGCDRRGDAQLAWLGLGARVGVRIRLLLG